MTNFKLGRYYLVNGMKARIINITALIYIGEVLIPDNLWVPTFWFNNGDSSNKAFNLKSCVEGNGKEIQDWESN